MLDPVAVTSQSSELVLTIRYNHVNMGTADGSRMLSKDSTSAMIQGLRRVYDKPDMGANGQSSQTGRRLGIRRGEIYNCHGFAEPTDPGWPNLDARQLGPCR
jgi:hypothetical protein